MHINTKTTGALDYAFAHSPANTNNEHIINLHPFIIYHIDFWFWMVHHHGRLSNGRNFIRAKNWLISHWLQIHSPWYSERSLNIRCNGHCLIWLRYVEYCCCYCNMLASMLLSVGRDNNNVCFKCNSSVSRFTLHLLWLEINMASQTQSNNIFPHD